MDEHRTASAVTVVIPAFNAAKTLLATLASVAAQTLPHFQVVLVDDGSTDDTGAIADDFASKDARFAVVHQANMGIADARNAGIRRARTPYIAALDADDLWHPTFLEKLSSALIRAGSGAALAYANSRVVDLSGFVLHSAPSFEQSGWVFSQLLVRNFIGNGSASMFRRDLALEIGGYERRLQHAFGSQGAEDWLLALHLAARGRVVAVNEYLVGYRFVPGGMSANTLRMRRSRVHALNALSAVVDSGDSPATNWALGEAHAKCFLHEMRDLQFAAALKSLSAALQLDPWGTLVLLFGSERLQWLRSRFVPAASSGLRPFQSFDPLEGRYGVRTRRLELARRWDDLQEGPLRMSGTLSEALSRDSQG